MAVILLRPYAGTRADTVRALEDLLAEAHAGSLVGIAYVALRQQALHSVGLAGLPRLSATSAALTRGLVNVLDDELAELISDLTL